MPENPFVRRFFRREADELTVHARSFSSVLRIVAYHIFASIEQDPLVEVVDRVHFDDSFREVVRASLTWETCAVGHDRTRQLVTEGSLFAIHHGLGDLQLVVSVGPAHDAVILKLVARAEDQDRLQAVLEWVERLENTDHPLKGKLFSLNGTGLSFLPAQGVGRDDVVLPAGVLDEIERNFAFLDRPESWPQRLRHRAVLLAGPPGVGKTLLAKWLSDRFRCTCLWATPGAVWELGAGAVFKLARQLRPALLILEDLDLAAGDRRGHQPLGDLLGQLDGFANLLDVAVLATTNHPEELDHALDPENRPGRFHRLLNVGPPDAEARSRLLRRLLAGSEVLSDVPAEIFDHLVDLSLGLTGAQIAELVTDLESRVVWRRRQGEPDELAVVVAELRPQRPATESVGFSLFAADHAER